jgi:type VI protein secretion system component Hcp
MRSKTMPWALAVVVMLVALSLAPPPAAADFSGFMKFPNLQGESTAQGHENEIELLSYNQAAGTNACFKVVVVKNLDRASPGLAVLAISNQVVTPVTVTLARQVSGALEPVFTAVLENVVVGTVELVEVDGTPTTTERVTLKPRKATLTYQFQSGTGAPTPVTTVVNCP